MKNPKLLALSTLIAAAATAATIPEAAASTAVNSSAASGSDYITYDSDSSTLTLEFDMSDYGSVSSQSEGSALTGDTKYYFDSTTTDNLVIGTNATTGIAITDANRGVATISGSVSGEGILAIYLGSAYSEGTTLTFTGDMSDFSGTLYNVTNNLSSTRHTYLVFSGTSTTAVSGTGTILSYDDITYSVSSGDVTVANSSITLCGSGELTFSGTNYTVTGTVTGASDISDDTTSTNETALTNSTSLTVDSDASVSGFATLTNSGTLTVSGTVSGITTLTSTGSITVEENGSLDLSGTTVELSDAISNSGTVTVSKTTVIDLTSDLLSEDGTTYVVISGSGTISSWDSDTLSYINFTVDGADLNSRSDVDVSTSGSVTITTASLTWASSSDAGWSDNSVWRLSSTGSTDSFLENDIVIFNSTASGTAKVSSDVTATSVTVTDSTTQTISVSSGYTLTAENLTVDSGATLTLTGEGTVSVTNLETSGTVSVGESTTLDLTGTTLTGASYNISGSGTVKLALLSGSWESSNTLGVGSNFTGTTYLSSGYVTISDSTTYGTNLTLADGVYLQVTKDVDNTVSFDGTLTLEGSSNIYTNSGTTLAFTSDATVTGSTLAKYGAGEMIFDGNTVNLTTFSVTDGGGTVTFNENGTYSFSTFTVSNGTLNLNSATITATTLTISGTNKYLYLSGDVTFDVSDTGTISKNIYDSDSDSGSLTKTGDGTLTLSGTNTYAGGTTVSAGTLQVSNASALGTGNVTVSGGTLSIDSDVTLSIATGTTLSVTGGTVSGAIELDGGTLSINSGVTLSDISLSVVLCDTYLLSSTTTSDDSSSTSSAAKSNTILLTSVADDDSGTTTTVYAIDGEGELSVSEITISLDEELADEIASLSADATYTFSLAASTISGLDNVTITLDGLDTSSWTASLSDGTLTLTYTIPEPGSFGLIAGTLALAFAASRRRRSRKA